uniref:VHS domain-containing protein n=2 Tax=Trichobilharzia regenti TaxID=157069 RepID=A0AA85IU65_TRIRE|nr:unnamed protein product [Trichobilharzia regenti]
MQNIFQPHPFSTAVGTLTERATDSGRPAEDWALILEICDLVNETDDGPKEAIRAIKKRLVMSAGRDNISIWYTLTLLETLVRNCGRRFHSQVANKEFLHAFLKLLSPKNDPPQQLQTKVLYMLKCWISSNWDVPGKRDLDKVYASLLQRGVQFPTVLPSECCLPKPLRMSARENLIISKSGPSIPQATGLQEKKKSIPRTMSVGSSGIESDFHQRSRLAVNPSHTSTLHPCSSCHCVHDSSGQPTACRYLHTRSNMNSSNDSSLVSSGRYSRSVHFNPRSQTRIHGVPANDGTVMVINSGRQDSSSIIHQQSQARCLPTSNTAGRINNSSSVINHDEMELDEEGTVRHLNASQRIKLTEDLAVVETNINVLNDLLAELRPDTVTTDDLNLLKELNCTCRAMHQRVMEFLSQVSDEEVTPSLIQVNDNLTHALSRYDRFERYYQLSLQHSDGNSNSNSQQSNRQLCLDSSRPQLCLTGPSGDNTDSRRNRSNQQQQQQQLAITAGPSRRSTKTSCIPNGSTVGYRVNGVQNHQREVSDNNLGVDDGDDDDDDESLLDISEGPSGITSRSHDSDETDEIAQWLSSRQLIPVDAQHQEPNRQLYDRQQANALSSNSRSHHRPMLNHSTSASSRLTTSVVTAATPINPTIGGALCLPLSTTHSQSTSSKPTQSHQSSRALL